MRHSLELYRPNCCLSLRCSSRQTVKVRLATVIVARAFDTPLYRTCFCSMSCARSLELIFSDDGQFDYFRFSYVLADLSCMRPALTLNDWFCCRYVGLTIANFLFLCNHCPLLTLYGQFD